MQITLREIKSFSKCPKRYWFLEDLTRKPLPQNITIATNAIKKSYMITNETGYKVRWRRVIGWVSGQVFKDVDVKDKEQYAAAQFLSKHILRFLHKWYHYLYIKEDGIAYTDISIETELSSHVVRSTLPIVRIDSVPTIIHINSSKQTEKQLVNNIEVCGQMAMLANELEVDDIGYCYLQMKEHGGFEVSIIERNREQHQKVLEMISQIAQSIMYRVEYPAVSSQCETCVFRRKCKI